MLAYALGFLFVNWSLQHDWRTTLCGGYSVDFSNVGGLTRPRPGRRRSPASIHTTIGWNTHTPHWASKIPRRFVHLQISDLRPTGQAWSFLLLRQRGQTLRRTAAPAISLFSSTDEYKGGAMSVIADSARQRRTGPAAAASCGGGDHRKRRSRTTSAHSATAPNGSARQAK